VTGPAWAHDRFDELAAGHALDALDPPEEREFAGHLDDCPRCQDALAGYLEITAALASSAPEAEEPSPEPRDRILAAAAGTARVADLAERRRRRRPRALISATAAALAVPLPGTRAFAVSRERGRTIPATPSRPVALGQVTS
jgi:anti-sigma factor RsiW